MQGIRVLDLSSNDAGAFCSRMLSTVGCEVVVVEPESGHRLRKQQPFLRDGSSATWQYLQANKRAVVASDADEIELAAGYDVVVLADDEPSSTLADRSEALRSAHRQLIVVVITGFGLHGSRADWKAGPLEHWAASGMMSLNGERDREPLPGGGPWLSRLVGAMGAIGAQAALINAATSGVGDLVDVDAMQALAAVHQWSIVLYTHNGVLKERAGNRHGEAHHPLSIHPCSDGWVCLAAVARHQWEGLCIAMDQVELLADDDLYVPAVRFDRADELDVLIDAWTSQRTVEEVVSVLQENQTPAGAVSSLFDTLADPQLAARDFWAAPIDAEPEVVMPHVPFRISGVTPSYQTAPRRPGSDVAGEGGTPGLPDLRDRVRPLSGVRVVEFSIAFAGPLVGRFLADLGADVVKVEHPTSRGLAMPEAEQMADEAKAWTWGQLPGPLARNGVFPNNDPGARWWNRMGIWNKMNRGKRSLCLDVKAPGGREVLERLIAESDVVFNNYSPRGVRSLEIDHETLRAINPGLVTVDMSGYGATGPDAHKVSWGPILDASSGMASTTGYPDSGPYKQGLALPDACGGILGSVALLGALWQRWQTGQGVHVDLSQLETFLALGGDQVLAASDSGSEPARLGARSAFAAPTGVYRCAGDDEWAVLSVTSDEGWQRLVAVIEDLGQDRSWDSLAARLKSHDAIDEIITNWTAARSKHEVMQVLQAAGVAASAVMTNADLFHDEHLAERAFFVELDQEDCGPQTFPGFPLNFDETPTGLAPSPNLGAHNEPILSELGYAAAQIEELVADGAVADRPPA